MTTSLLCRSRFGLVTILFALFADKRPALAQNLAPSATNVFITPAYPLLNQSLTANYTFSDPNGDAQSGTQIRWFRNGRAAPFNDDQTTGVATGTYTVSFTSLGSLTTTNLHTGGVVVTARSSPGVSGTVNVLNLNGLGVVGGIFSDTVDSSESLRFQFDDGAVTEVKYFVSSAGNQNGNGTGGDGFITGFDAGGNSLGTVAVNGTGTKDVSALFGNQPLSAFEVRANQDNQRIDSVQYRAFTPSTSDAWYFTVRPSDGILFGNVVQSPTVQVQPDCSGPTTASFTSLGSLTTTNLHTGGVVVTATSSPGVSGTVNVLNLNGLGVVGGIFSETVDSSESLRFQFDDGAVTEVKYFISSAGNQNGNGTVGDGFITGFDAGGNSLGTVAVNGTGTKDVSLLFGNQPLSAFEVRANQDNQRIDSLQYRAAATVAFAQAQFTVSELGTPSGPPVTLVRLGSKACVSALVISITGGTAQTNVDYIATNFPMSVTFAPGETNVTVPVRVLQDALTDGTETITFSLAPVFNCTIGGLSNATLNLTDSPVPPVLTGLARLGDGAFQFTFANHTGATFTVLAATNVRLPLINWTPLGPVTETSAGQYQFTDRQATNHPQRYYRVRSP